MSEIYFHNYYLEKDVRYFLYIGELKNYGLNQFLKEALERITGRPHDFIAIIPDVFEQYNYRNVAVINPQAQAMFLKYGRRISCRISSRQFMRAVSSSRQVNRLIAEILQNQDELFIYMYESLPEMCLDEIPGVKILGPDSEVAHRLNNKVLQYRLFEGKLPLVDYRICRGLDELYKVLDDLWGTWSEGIFVTTEYSAAGVNSIIAHSTADVRHRFDGLEVNYLISRYMPHEFDPTVLAVTADENEVYIAGVADQTIEDGTRFTGSKHPSVLPPDCLTDLEEYTRRAGRILARQGYRGIFGCDYLVAADGEIRFLEVNARKQGTTMEFCCTLEQILPPGAPLLPELEYYAVTQNRFPEHTVEPTEDMEPGFHWGTYNYKLKNRVLTEGYIPQNTGEREAFARMARGELKKDYLILEHIGSDFIVDSGSFLGRTVALGFDRSSVIQGLEQGRKMMSLTAEYDLETKYLIERR